MRKITYNIIVNHVLTILTITIYLALPDQDYYYFFIALILILFLSNHIAYSLKNSRLQNPISIDIVFIIGFIIMSFSIPLMIVLRLEDFAASYLWNRIAIDYFDKSLSIALLAIIGFSIGFMYKSKKIKSYDKKMLYLKNHTKILNPYFTGIFLVLGTFTFGILFVNVKSNYLSGSYQGVYGISEFDHLLLYLTQIFLTISFISIVIRSERNNQNFTIKSIKNFFLALPYFSLLLFLAVSGDRGELIVCCMPALYFLFGRIRKRLQLFIFSIILVIGIFFIGILRESRNLEDRGFLNIIDTTINYTITDGIKIAATNIGASGLMLPAAMQYRDHYQIDIGLFTWNSFLGIIPYLRRILSQVGLYADRDFYESAQLLQNFFLRSNTTTGVGTSSTAEFYLDFGIVGVFIGHLVIGMIASILKHKFELILFDERIKILYIFSIGVFAIIPRYSPSALLVKLILYAAIAIYLVEWFTSRKSLKGD